MTSAEGGREHAVSRFVESFASALVEAGVPHMPALVFVTLLATDSGGLTAEELATQLQVSRAAISGAVKYLDQVGLTSRERQPGSRRYRYVLRDPTWYTVVARREDPRALDRHDPRGGRSAGREHAGGPAPRRIAGLLRVPERGDARAARPVARAARRGIARSGLSPRAGWDLVIARTARPVRTVGRLVALALGKVPIDVLAERLGTTRGALYKTLHDARRKLRGVLAAGGYVESAILQERR